MCIYDMLFYICMLCVYTHVLIYTHMHRLEVWRLAARQADSRCLVRAARAFWHYCSSRSFSFSLPPSWLALLLSLCLSLPQRLCQ